MRVLVVEDDEGIAHGLRTMLRQQGAAVDVVGSVAAAWRALRVESFDVVLLDLGLPDADGSTLVERIRAAPVGALPDPATPVLIMTARDKVASRIAVLDMGADDYVIKPFDAGELAARMRALQRRARGRTNPLVVRGEVAIDTTNRLVRRGGTLVELSAKEYSLLLMLLDASPCVLSRARIHERLYNFEVAIDSNTIEVHVHHLRRKLGDKFIRTMRGVGYFIPIEHTT